MRKLCLTLIMLLFTSFLFAKGLKKEHRISIGDRTIFAAVESDDVRNPALLVLPYGPGGNCEYMRTGLGKQLKKMFTVVYVDLYGGGRSPVKTEYMIYNREPVKGLTAENAARDAGLVMEILGYETYGILGHDFGAYTGLLLAAEKPESIRFFAAVNPRFDYDGTLRHTMYAIAENFHEASGDKSLSASWALYRQKKAEIVDIMSREDLDGYIMEKYHKLFKAGISGTPWGITENEADNMDKMVRKLQKLPAFRHPYNEYGYAAYLFSDAFYNNNITEGLYKLSEKPVLIISSEEGPFSYRNQNKKIEEDMPFIHFSHLQCAGFYPMLEKREEFIQLMSMAKQSLNFN